MHVHAYIPTCIHYALVFDSSVLKVDHNDVMCVCVCKCVHI
jgi:hypothetical protein